MDPLRNSFLARLPASDLALVTSSASLTDIDQGDVVQQEQRNVKAVHFPLSGMLSLLVVLRDGRTVETSVVGREGIVGARAGLGIYTSRIRVVAQLPVQALVMPAPNFIEMVKGSTAVAELCLSNADLFLDQARITAACNAFHTVEERLCRWLLHTADRAESNNFIMTQELLSQMLGVRRTSITEVAMSLQEQGAVTYARGKVQILEPRILKKLSCECYDLLKTSLE